MVAIDTTRIMPAARVRVVATVPPLPVEARPDPPRSWVRERRRLAVVALHPRPQRPPVVRGPAVAYLVKAFVERARAVVATAEAAAAAYAKVQPADSGRLLPGLHRNIDIFI